MTNRGVDPASARGNLLVGVLAGMVVGLLLVGAAWVVFSGGRAVPGPAPTPSRTPSVTSVASTPARPAGSASASAAPTSAAASDTPAGLPITTSLPPGSFVLVLDSLPKGSTAPEAAVESARQLSTSQFPVIVVDSDVVRGFNPGYYALVVANFTSRDQAVAVCPAFGRPTGGTCYPRQIGA